MTRKNITVLASYLVGYMYITQYSFSFSEYYNFHRMLFLIIFVAWVELTYYFVGEKPERKVRIEPYFWLFCLICVATVINLDHGYIVRGDGLTEFFAGMFMHSLAIYWVLVRFDILIDGETGRFFLLDLFYGSIIIPIGNCLFREKIILTGGADLLKKGATKKEGKGKILPTVFVIFGSILLLLAVISLLSDTDENFAKIFDNMFLALDFNFYLVDHLYYLIFSIPIGGYLFGLVYGSQNKIRKAATANTIITSVQKFRTINPALLAAIVILFSAVYALYIGLQVSYFIGGFFGELPENFTYAQYARQGFFELCVIMGINLCLLFAVSKLTVKPLRQQKLLKITSLTFLVICMFFAITALSKLILYIDAYWLTALRLLSGWAILVLIVATVLSFITILKPIKAVRVLVYFAVTSFAVFCFI